MRHIFCLSLYVALSLGTYAQIQTFSLNVYLTQYTEGEEFILQYNNEKVSAKVMSAQLTFEGALDGKSPVMALLLSTRRKEPAYIGFWLGPGRTTITQQRRQPLRHAVVDGHSYNTEVNEYKAMVAPLEKKEEKLETKAEKLSARGKDSAAILRKYEPRFEQLEAQIAQTTRNYIRMYPHRQYSLALLHTKAKEFGPDSTQALLALMPDTFRHSSQGKDLQRYLELHKKLSVGDRYADVVQPDTLGRPVALSSMEGRWLLLEFWAAWCGPCRVDNPALKQVYNTFHHKGFDIYAVSIDNDRTLWLKAIAEDGLPWIQVSELKGTYNDASLTYGVYAVPDNVLISPEGKIVARGIKPRELYQKLSEVLP